MIREKSSILVVIREFMASLGARFSKLPKLSGSISGAVISYVSERQRRFQELNFATSLPFRILKS